MKFCAMHMVETFILVVEKMDSLAQTLSQISVKNMTGTNRFLIMSMNK